jgi:hypothetical protein
MFLAGMLVYANTKTRLVDAWPGHTYVQSGFPLDFQDLGGAGYVVDGFAFLWFCFLFWIGAESWIGRKTALWCIVLCTGLFAAPLLCLPLGDYFCHYKVLETQKHVVYGWPVLIIVFQYEDGNWVDFVDFTHFRWLENYLIALLVIVAAVLILTAAAAVLQRLFPIQKQLCK